jgi:hypothetical protein
MSYYEDKNFTIHLNYFRYSVLHGALESGFNGLKLDSTPDDLVIAFKKLYRKINSYKLKTNLFKEKYLEGIKKVWKEYYYENPKFTQRKLKQISKFDINVMVTRQLLVSILIDFYKTNDEILLNNSKKVIIKYSKEIYLSKDIERILSIDFFTKKGGKKKGYYRHFDDHIYYEIIDDIRKLMNF